MMPLHDCKFARMLEPISINGTAATTTEVDTKADGIGWDHFTGVFMFGAIGATFDEITIQESDTSGSGFANITGATFTDPVGTTDNNKIIAISIPLASRKRYLKPVVDPGAGATLVAGLAILSRGRSPLNATEAGLLEWLKLG